MADTQKLNFLKNIAKRTGIPLKKILDMLHFLAQEERIENVELLQKVALSRNGINQVKQGLSEYLQKPSEVTELNQSGRDLVTNIIEQKYQAQEQMYGFLLGESYNQSLVAVKKHKLDLLESARQYDQFTATRETVAKRIALMDFLCDLEGSSIAFLGDDDFTSIGVAALGKAEKITVLDIDKRILDTLEKLSFAQKYAIQTDFYDARKRLSESQKGKYDVVFTDPPYTPDGLSLFVSRSIELLNPANKVARVYLCFGTSDRSKERYLPLQKILSESGLLIRFAYECFNKYRGAESVGDSSNLYICEVTPQTKPIIEGEFKDEIYTA